MKVYTFQRAFLHMAIVAAFALFAFGAVWAQDEGETPPAREREAKAPPSNEKQAEAEEFLADAYKRYHLPIRDGLESFGAEIKIVDSRREELRKFMNQGTIIYNWKAPDTEKINVKGGAGVLGKGLQEYLLGIWRDIAAGGVFVDLDGKTLSLESTDIGTALAVSLNEKPAGRIIFDPETKIVVEARLGGRKNSVSVEPSYTLVDELLRLESRRVASGKGKGGGSRFRSTVSYSGFRTLNSWSLPTRITVELGKESMVFQVEYTRINDGPALIQEADIGAVKALVKEFEKEYTKMSLTEKLAGMKKLGETGHELAAAAIAKRCLKDRDSGICKEAANLLGSMRCRNVVTSMTRDLKRHEDDLDVYLEIIKALGLIGDPKAIPSLSRDFWNQKDEEGARRAAQAKIEALGNIRSKKSVDALIDMMYLGKRWTWQNLARDFSSALMKLTGRNNGGDRDEWKGWWTDNKNKFKLEEDR